MVDKHDRDDAISGILAGVILVGCTIGIAVTPHDPRMDIANYMLYAGAITLFVLGIRTLIAL